MFPGEVIVYVCFYIDLESDTFIGFKSIRSEERFILSYTEGIPKLMGCFQDGPWFASQS